jgi:hypothetical protein
MPLPTAKSGHRILKGYPITTIFITDHLVDCLVVASKIKRQAFSLIAKTL